MPTDPKALLLIMPPQLGLLNGFAAGLISLANYVAAREPETTVRVLDLSAETPENLESALATPLSELEAARLIVGITSTTSSYQSALQVARIVKRARPESVVVLGGHHATADFDTVLLNHHDVIDLIILGEGERPLLELVRRYPAIDSVPGSVRFESGSVVPIESPALLSQQELDSIPIIYGKTGLIGVPGKFDHVTYVSARGCHHRCSFCAVGNGKIRAKSVAAVVRDIESLIDAGFSHIAIEDNFFAHSPRRTREICTALQQIKARRNGSFAWDCQTRVEALARPDTIGLMAPAGCEAVYIGVESFQPKHLRFLGKTSEPDNYLSQFDQVVLPALLKSTIDCYVNLQFGLPGETPEDQRETTRVLRTIGHSALQYGKTVTVFPQLYVTYPGTAHFYAGVAEGRYAASIFEAFTNWESRELPILFWLGEHFAHGTGGIPEGIMNSPRLREGLFEINSTAVFRIIDTLKTISELPGIRLFRYGKYIVPRRSEGTGGLVP